MNLINKKAFFLVETIVVISIVGVVITFLFKNFSKLYNSYNTWQNYNTVAATNASSNIKKYIDSLNIDYATILSTNDYVDITNLPSLNNDYYSALKNSSNILKVFLINLTPFFDDPTNLNNFNINERNYLNTLQDKSAYYMIVVETKNNQFAALSVYDYYLNLNGNNNDEYATYVKQNTEYVDPGYESKDSKGNILDVYISGFVDTSILGTYYLNYSVGKIQISRKVVVTPTNEYNATKGVNIPKLNTGMVPVKWNGVSWVNTTYDDTDWYDYSNKKWANAMTADGSMWVWIPRYIYRISTGWHTNTAGTIDVQFSIGTDDTRGGTVTLDTGTTSDASNNKWTNHPAFTFGSTQLTGIWVAKFEATASEGVANGYVSDSTCPTTGDNVITKTIQILPNKRSWRCINVGNAFTVTRNMEASNIYGWGLASILKTDGIYTTDTNNLDTHLIKNIEWGAVSYLSKSTYGKNTTEVWINNDQNYTTGCAANSATQAANNGCLNTYETTNGVKASTTGTIYGVYDMVGASWERMPVYVSNSNSNLNTYGESIINANTKYKDIYQVNTTDDQANNYLLTINKKGEAVYETSNNVSGSNSWFGDYSYMPNTSSAYFSRGGGYNNGAIAGMFAFGNASGAESSVGGFRPVLLVGTGL